MTFPIRLKLLLMVLGVVLLSILTITLTMADLFQKDKALYISDATATRTLYIAKETEALLSGYHEQIRTFTLLWQENNIDPVRKASLLNQMLGESPEIISLTVYGAEGRILETLYNPKYLESAGISSASWIREMQSPPPLEEVRKQGTLIYNATRFAALPAFTLALMFRETDPALGVSAQIHLRRLQELVGRTSAYTTFLMDSHQTVLAHPDIRQVVGLAHVAEIPLVRAFLAQPTFAGTLEYQDKEKTALLGAYARLKFHGLAAMTTVPKSMADITAQDLARALVWVSLGAFSVCAIVSLLWARRLTRPIHILSEAAREVASGNFNVRVNVKGRDEVGLLADSFNGMTSELEAREAGLKSAHAALIQSEKMAAFGQLGAGIAHEIKNPLAGILGYAQLALRKVDAESPVIHALEVIEKETRRCRTIVDNLMRFARQEKTEFSHVHLNRVVEDALAIVDHQMSLNRVRIEKTLAETLPAIRGNANQLQQVLINLMINAQQAMPEGGAIRVLTYALDHQITVAVSDTGEGMPPEIQQKIFEPFFTTKPVGQGTGLGLSVSYGIIKEHGGIMQLKSGRGEGTTFTLQFPVLPEPEDSVPHSDQAEIHKEARS